MTVDELMEAMPGPDFPTGGIICGSMGIRQAFISGRSTITLRSRTHFETEGKADVIVVTEFPIRKLATVSAKSSNCSFATNALPASLASLT